MNLAKTLALAVLSMATVNFAADTRYKDRLFDVEKDSVTIDSVPYFVAGSNLSTLTLLLQFGKAFGAYNDYIMYFYKRDTLEYKPLLADVYTPTDDSEKNRPMILVLHGGAFVAGDRTDTAQKTVAYCDSLAARGFVTASLDYFTGVVMEDSVDPSDSAKTLETVDSASFARTVYRGVQDVRAAIRYFRANASEYGIDTNKIFIMGNSAGALLGLEDVFALEEDDYPEYIDVDTLAKVGDLDEYGPLNYGSVANGVVSLWGAIHDPKLISNNKVPLFLAHGDDDGTIYFGVGRPLDKAEATIRKKDKNNSLASLNFAIHTPTLYGSQVVDSILTANRVNHETFFQHGAGHEFYNDTVFVQDTVITKNDSTDAMDTVINKIPSVVYEDSLRPRIFDFLYALATDSYKLDMPEAPTTDEIPTNIYAIASQKLSPAYRMDEGNMGFTLVQGENVSYAVYNMQGRKVLGGRVSAGSHIDFSNIGRGVYTLLVRGTRGMRFGLSH